MWADVEIVSLEQGKAHIRRRDDTDEDDVFELMLRQAHGLVLDYIARASDVVWTAVMLAWDDETAPPAVQAAILRQFADLARFRGDDEDDKGAGDGTDLSPRVKQLLRMYRTPVVA